MHISPFREIGGSRHLGDACTWRMRARLSFSWNGRRPHSQNEGSKFSFSLRPSERYPLDARTPASLRSLALFSFLRRSFRLRCHETADLGALSLRTSVCMASLTVSVYFFHKTSHLFLSHHISIHLIFSCTCFLRTWNFPSPSFSSAIFHKGRIAKTIHESKTRKCTSCDTSIQPGVH